MQSMNRDILHGEQGSPDDLPPRRKAALIVLDGLGDRPVRELNMQTPLEAAETPNLDRLAGLGASGLVDPIAPGVIVGTHIGMGVLLGIPPELAATLPRGPIEAAGANVELRAGDIALRCNFAHLQPSGTRKVILDRRAGRHSLGLADLCSSLQNIDLAEGVRASLFPATGPPSGTPHSRTSPFREHHRQRSGRWGRAAGRASENSSDGGRKQRSTAHSQAAGYRP